MLDGYIGFCQERKKGSEREREKERERDSRAKCPKNVNIFKEKRWKGFFERRRLT